jgi:ankyrin repeat protein
MAKVLTFFKNLWNKIKPKGSNVREIANSREIACDEPFISPENKYKRPTFNNYAEYIHWGQWYILPKLPILTVDKIYEYYSSSHYQDYQVISFFLFCYYGHLSELKKKDLKSYFNTTEYCWQKNNLYSIAAFAGHYNIMKYLKKIGYEYKGQKSRYNTNEWALLGGNKKIIRYLKIDVFKYPRIFTLAAHFGCLKTIKYYVSCGFNIHYIDSYNNNAYTTAIIENNLDIIKYLESLNQNLESLNQNLESLIKNNRLIYGYIKKNKYIKKQKMYKNNMTQMLYICFVIVKIDFIIYIIL